MKRKIYLTHFHPQKIDYLIRLINGDIYRAFNWLNVNTILNSESVNKI